MARAVRAHGLQGVELHKLLLSPHVPYEGMLRPVQMVCKRLAQRCKISFVEGLDDLAVFVALPDYTRTPARSTRVRPSDYHVGLEGLVDLEENLIP